ncbi:membrane-bound PQQ-dependent dehydrogenase, glucose/quinate/shikimate family [Thalassorhabdomicrobium marinisediminis]|uniref:Membrane-bound PQQ-dependent dehydrogenase, glucose/quinate/shikimate family n=1 Tax=Thalassorhabdomicrobium marinisediminis TaxID=2170577 RepID=A0A2T7FTB7_9RHOB|nr:membrane-bound PQQ-dependent dehydrogenase, glucose/quinate/shikimate family [Thalassorhabdomicrobium marinisediminis]PVA05409.1 membrane-bound PQQ-dependent dehydrogenase, glucose/quinate/shikimate family [Thalassorhabdomicrobium marinisediminis]
MLRIILSILILALGGVLAVGGVELISLGGAWGYVALGALLVLSAVLMFARRKSGLAVYGVAVLFALVWGVLEVGLYWWGLAPRGGLLVLLGLVLLLPPIPRGLTHGTEGFRGYGAEGMVLVASIAVAAVVAVISMVTQPYDTAGRLASDRVATPPVTDADVADGEWASYGRTAAGQRYSPLAQITPENIADLEVAWQYNAGDVHVNLPGTALQTTPLIVDDTMYLCTPKSEVIALDPVTGEERWRFSPTLIELTPALSTYATCRGLTYHDGSDLGWEVSDEPAPTEQEAEALIRASMESATTQAAGVAQNIVAGTAQEGDPNPIILDQAPETPEPMRADCLRRIFLPTRDARLIAVSAETGTICPGFGGPDGTVNLWIGMPNVSPTAFYSTSPPTIAGDVLVVGGSVNDNLSDALPSGAVRAYDIRTGRLTWNFDPGNPDDTSPIEPGETFTQNVPNSWAPGSYDVERDLVFLPFGSGSPDQYGGDRSENVDRFTASIVALDGETGALEWVFRTVNHDIWDYDVPAQPTLVDLTIDGETVPALVQATKQGEIFVLNRETGEPVLPVSEIEVSQNAVPGERPAPTQPVSEISFAPPHVTGAQMWGLTPVDQMMCRIAFAGLNYEGRYTPPSLEGTLTHPGSFGVFNWGGVAVDPARQVAFAMPVYLGFTSTLYPRPDTLDSIVSAPGYPMGNENFGTPYAAVLRPFMSKLGLPCQQPPWGFVAGIDLTNGETVYQHVNGTVEDMAPIPLPLETGVPGIGGPIVTGGGVAFLSGQVDYYVRGYDLSNGEVLWKSRLPAGGQSTPATYLGRDGRQYVVVVAGGHGYVGTKLGDAVIAYRLPEE